MFPCSGVDHKILVWYQLKRWGKCFWGSSETRKQDKDKTFTSKMKVNGCLKLLMHTHFQSCVCERRWLVLTAVHCGRVGTPLAVCCTKSLGGILQTRLCTSSLDGGAVNLYPSHMLAGNLMLPFVGNCRLCDADLLPAWAMGWRWGCGRHPFHGR